MQVGLTLFGETLSPEGARFAAQLGVRKVVIHLVHYGRNADPSGWLSGEPGPPQSEDMTPPVWGAALLREHVAMLRREGVEVAAIENLPPALWSDILLNGPDRDRQISGLKQLVRDMGEVGIPMLGYNFSLAGVWGWQRRPVGRGGAMATTFDLDRFDHDRPIPDGVVWNTRVRETRCGPAVTCSEDDLWQRLAWFLKELVPVAEEAGVVLAAHPDDPPVERLRGTPRLVNSHDKYDRLLSLFDSPSNAMQFCIGSLMEMPGDIYETTRRYLRSGRVAYVHFRNVKGKVPRYEEAFVDDGDTDMGRIARILHEENYAGILVPDHVPEITCPAPWHVGMAHALGYMNGLIAMAPKLAASGTH